jgi:RNA polymerase sigma-70 factor (ECF subfamily)
VEGANSHPRETGTVTDWDRIVRDHGPMVFGTAWRILGHAADTEDVVQEVFMECYRLRETRRVRHWGGYLRRLAACRALDRLRQRKPLQTLEGLSLYETDIDPETAAVGHELADRLREAIAQLPEREGEVFSLRYFEELSYDEIADQLEVTRGAVATALHKARGKLEELLTEVNEETSHER